MLEVMNASSAELPRSGGDQGILLNCWNKSSPLIKELERTVNFAERKCGDLMQQLHFYKEYYEKWAQFERVNRLRDTTKESCRQTSDFGSSSENELETANRYFYKKIQSKINEMNKEITQVNRKIHSRGGNPSLPGKHEGPEDLDPEGDAQEASGPPSPTLENKTCKSEPVMTSCEAADAEVGGGRVTGKQSSKSVPCRNKASKSVRKDSGSSKKRYANLQRYKIRSKSLPQGVRRKFGFGGFFEVFEADSILRNNVKSRSKSKISLKADSSKSCKNRKSKTGLPEARKPTPKSSTHRITRSKSGGGECGRNEGKYQEAEAKEVVNFQRKSAAPAKVATGGDGVSGSTPLVPPTGMKEVAKTELSLSNNLRNLLAKPNSLLPFLRNPIPFIPCSSTSKSFNLGLNVQQVLSLIKRKRHSVTLQAIVRSSMQAARSMTEPAVNTLFISQTTTSHSHVTSATCPAREGSEDSFSTATEDRSKCGALKQLRTLRSTEGEGKTGSPGVATIEINKLERPEDVWVVEQPDPSSRQLRDSRSKCTCFPSKHCVDYNKVLRQYTSWRLPLDPPSAYLPACPRPKLSAVSSADSPDFGGGEKDGRIELMKIHNDLLNLTRKYSSLQKQISQNNLDDCEASAELDAMESELAIREIEFKDILNFYNQLTVLKEKLRSLRSRIGQNQSAARQPECQRPKKNPLRSTPSMALARALRKIQGLQDKIKLIDFP